MHPILITAIVILSIVLVLLLAEIYMIYPGKKRREMEKYKIYTKPISELSNKEKERIILQYHSIQKTFGIEIPKGKMYTDEEVESIREVLKPENSMLYRELSMCKGENILGGNSLVAQCLGLHCLTALGLSWIPG